MSNYSYSSTVWHNGSAGSTPITAANLNNIEQGIVHSFSYADTISTELGGLKNDLGIVVDQLVVTPDYNPDGTPRGYMTTEGEEYTLANGHTLSEYSLILFTTHYFTNVISTSTISAAFFRNNTISDQALMWLVGGSQYYGSAPTSYKVWRTSDTTIKVTPISL